MERVTSSMVYLSVEKKDLTVATLIRQARHIRNANQANWSGQVAFFTTRRAARTFTMNALVDPPTHIEESSTEFLAMFTVEQGKEYLTVMPFGYSLGFNDVRTALDGAELPQCGYHVAGRCLLSLSGFDRANAAITGAVELEARITRQGKLEGIQILEVRADQANRRETLVRAARANAKTWWLESGRNQDHVRIMYLFGNAASTSDGPFELMMDAPGHVKVLSAPLKPQ